MSVPLFIFGWVPDKDDSSRLLRPIYTRRYSCGIPRGIAHLSNQRTFIYFCVTPERYRGGIALDRFQSDIPAVYRRPAVLLTNQRFCFAVVMPQPVTTLAGSDAYLGHQKQDVGEFNPSRPGARYAVCALPQGIQECEEEAARVGRDRGVPAYDSWRLFCRLCRRLNTNKSNKRSCISRRLSPPLSMTLCGDYGNETRSSTHLYLL